MKKKIIVNKIGHCALVIEIGETRILTDPGSYTVEAHSQLKHIDFILFTHEHSDHYHLESLKVLIRENPAVQIFANTSVSSLLEVESVPHTVVQNGDTVELGLVQVTGIGEKHVQMHKSIPASSNTGFFIGERLWYPGDAFTDPQRDVEILALPVSGPWMKISEAIDYALQLKPTVAFPVHDGTRFGSAHTLPAKILPENGIAFLAMVEGSVQEF